MFRRTILPFMMCFPMTVNCGTSTNYVNPDPKQRPIVDLEKTEDILDLPGECHPTGNGIKEEKTVTYCGSAASKGQDFDTNKNGDKFKAILNREKQSSIWYAALYWDVKPGFKVLANIGDVDKKNFHQEELTGTGEKILSYKSFPGKSARYFSWQAYRINSSK